MMPNILDVTPLKQTGLDLHKAIVKAVKDYSTSGYLPDRIKMTPKQFEVLSGYGHMMGTQDISKEHLYRTHYNVMEVDVKL